MPPSTRADQLEQERRAFRAALGAMTVAARRDLIARARRARRWPDDEWIERHIKEHMPARISPRQYVDRAQAIKKLDRTLVRAFVHDSYSGGSGDLARTLAFLDPTTNMMVWVDVATETNVSLMYLNTTVDRYLAEKGDRYWEIDVTTEGPA